MVRQAARTETATVPITVLIASRMAELGLTDRSASERLGVSQPTVTRWRHGRSIPMPENFAALGRFLGITKNEVIAAVHATARPLPQGKARKGTMGELLRRLETERNIEPHQAWPRYGIDKSRYYRLRSDLSAPRAPEIPALAAALDVPEETVVMAAYRTALARDH